MALSLMDQLRAVMAKRGWKQSEAAEAIGVSQPTIARWLKRGQEPEGPSRDKIRELYQSAMLGGQLDSMDVAHLSIPAEHIESEQVASGIGRALMPAPVEGLPPPDEIQPDLAFDRSDTHDLPLFASVEGGPGEMVVSNDPIGWLPRPRWLDGRDEAYAVRVTGTSMVPRYEPGEVVYVDPHEPLQRDKDAIFISQQHGEFRASIKRLVRWEHHQWYIRQFNPPREGWWPKKQWPKAYRVLGRRDS